MTAARGISLLAALVGLALWPMVAGAAPAATARHQEISAEGGGHFKSRGQVSAPADDTILGRPGGGPLFDGNLELRLWGRLLWGSWGRLEAHYETVAAAGDSRRRLSQARGSLTGLPESLLPASINDDRRLFNLTRTIASGKGSLWLHRLDRLHFTLLRPWGSLRLGRQAVTWGNGLIFNPMDLFNPFAPTDIERDYKVGDDMAYLQVPLVGAGGLQALLVPRRDPAGGSLESDQSSLAAKLRLSRGTTEIDLMAAYHYADYVAGLGLSGYLGEAAWRADAVYTFFDEGGGYLALVANLDYSWSLGGKNWYGLVELYLNTIGKRDYAAALADPRIAERLARGELFTLGRYYLSGHVRVELHPLVNFLCTVIANLQDPSGSLQPRLAWDAAQNLQVLVGVNLFFGGAGSEFGGFALPGTSLRAEPAPSFFIWLTWYF